MVKILAFYDAPIGCYAADRRNDGRTDRIPEFNTSLIGRGKNGSILNEIINSSNAVILNKKDEFTYYRERSGYKEILDLFICYSSLYSYINECYVDYDLELQSDHIPVKFNFKNLTAVESEELCYD